MTGGAALRAASIGTEAARALRPGRRGHVEAVFARSFYGRFDDDWVCLGEPGIGRGPLNVTLDVRPGVWPRPVVIGPAVAEPGLLRIGDLVVEIGETPLWSPEHPPAWTPDSLAAGLRALDAGVVGCHSMEGLGAFIRTGAAPVGHTARAAAPAVSALAGWLAATAAPVPISAVRSLLGLGPGLTPSGDDFLAGALAVLRLVGRRPEADALWSEIALHAPQATSDLSFAHLRAANRSGLGEPLHLTVLAILAGSGAGVRRALGPLAAGGNTSPFDVLAGCAAALRPTA